MYIAEGGGNLFLRLKKKTTAKMDDERVEGKCRLENRRRMTGT